MRRAAAPAKRPAAAAAKRMAAKAPAKRPAAAVKKPAAAPAAKVAKKDMAPVLMCEKTAVIAKSGLAGKARVVKEETKKAFVKATLTWDVELVLHDPAKGTDKYYNMQVLYSTEGTGQSWAVQHWGRTGMPGTFHMDGPYEAVVEAKKVFKKRFRQKTGMAWGQLGGSFEEDIPGKYKLLAKDAARPAEACTWQYYLHNKVDGKKIGWYDYEGKANLDMEKYWVTHETNAGRGLEVRFIKSDYFRYEINFKEMTQTNMTSGTRRVIRRVPAGERGSPEPPAHIPEAAKPVKPAEESDDEEDEPVPESDEDEEADEGEGAEEGGAEDAEAEAEAEADEKPAGREPPPEEAEPAGRAPPPADADEDMEPAARAPPPADEEAAVEPAGRAPPPADEETDTEPAGRAPPPADEDADMKPAGRAPPPEDAAPAEDAPMLRLPMDDDTVIPDPDADGDAGDTLIFSGGMR